MDRETAPAERPPAAGAAITAGAGGLAWTLAAAFGCYFCMYAFRKPFTAASYAETTAFGVAFKPLLVTAQIMGYMISKFVGIRVVSELRPERRAGLILWLILAAEGALLLFAVVPRPWNAAALFLNGLPLGMVFGLVLGFLEGRRTTELLTAGLCTSFILADGVTKSVGAWLLSRGVSEEWMPAAAGLIFLAPLAACVAMLARVPPPSGGDVAARTARPPMGAAERRAFLARHAGVLVPLVVLYLLVTVLRSVRGDFAPELWSDLGSPAVPGTFSRSETWVALVVLLAGGATVTIGDNRRAFLASLGFCGAGLAAIAAALAGQAAGRLPPFPFMVLLGLGLYLPYVAIHTTVFERLLAIVRERANLGFLMYLVDSVGYLGVVAVMLARNSGLARHGVLDLVRQAGWLTCCVGAACLAASVASFARSAAGRAAGSAAPGAAP